MPIITSPQIRVSINNQDRKQIRAVGLAPGNVNQLVKLTDVDATDPDNNETLVYDEASGKYVIKTLPIVSGGTF
jgi:hypothetical protein